MCLEMTSYSVIDAIDTALVFLGLNRLRCGYEDTESYYFTGCGDNGETIYANATCRVDKKTLSCDIYASTDFRMFTRKKIVQIPKERENVFIPWTVEGQNGV